MTFAYKNVVISGSRSDTEGTSKFIQEAKTFLEAAGWTVTDDRSSQPGSASGASTHKIVFQSNGEEGSYPTFYMTVFSGTGAAAGTSLTSFYMSTAYDVGSNDVPASGVITNTTSNQSTANTLNTPFNQDYEVWMSGDSEGVVFITKQSPSTYDSMAIGRLNSFHGVEKDPYPLIVNGTSSAVILLNNTNARAIYGNPPQAFNNNNETEVIVHTGWPGTNNQPYDLGTATSIYLAMPLIVNADDGLPLRKGMMGTIRNCWRSGGTNVGIFQEGTLIASGTDGAQTYRAFTRGTTQSLVIRQE